MRNAIWAVIPAALPIALMASAPVAASGLVVNGGFETGDFAGWTFIAEPGFDPDWVGVGGPSVTSFPYDPYEGDFHAYFGTSAVAGPGPRVGILQEIPTIIGETYTLTFALNSDPGFEAPAAPEDNDLDISFGDSIFSIAGYPYLPWLVYQLPPIVATSSSTVLSFLFRNDPWFFGLDAVTVTGPVTPIPEPDTWGMMILGMGMVGAAMRRRKVRVSFG